MPRAGGDERDDVRDVLGAQHGHRVEHLVEAGARGLVADMAGEFRVGQPGLEAVTRTSRPASSVRTPSANAARDARPRTPALVLGRRMDVLAWNRLSAALICDFAALESERRNMLRLVFLDSAAPALYPEWDRVAGETVAYLRLAAGRDPDDPALAALVGELSVKSEPFRRPWARPGVREKTHGRKRMDHPLVGPLELDYETLALPAVDQLLVTYTAAPGSASQTALDLLSSLAGGQSPRPSGADTLRALPGD